MHIAIPRVKDVADLQAVLPADSLDGPQRGCDFRSWNDTVLDIVSGADAANRAKGILTPLPKQISFGGGFGDPDLAGSRFVADTRDLDSLLFYRFDQSF